MPYLTPPNACSGLSFKQKHFCLLWDWDLFHKHCLSLTQRLSTEKGTQIPLNRSVLVGWFKMFHFKIVKHFLSCFYKFTVWPFTAQILCVLVCSWAFRWQAFHSLAFCSPTAAKRRQRKIQPWSALCSGQHKDQPEEIHQLFGEPAEKMRSVAQILCKHFTSFYLAFSVHTPLVLFLVLL